MSSTLSKAISGRLATPSIFTRTFMLGIVGSLAAYLTSWENADRVRDNYLEKNRESGDTFDFIVVGGGTAGVILANRLSEKFKTLLLEAGGEPHPFQAVPLLSNFLLNYAETDWRHVTMPQKQGFLGSVQSRASISQGRGLGGTSNLDYMMYLRGHPQDYDNWAEVTEDKSWAYKSLVKYFKSLEEYVGPWQGENHGQSGPMKIKQPSFTGLGKQFCHAAQENGYKHTDLNDKFQEGCDILTYPSKRGYRDSIYNSFYKPAKDSQNLVVFKYAHVNKILVRGSENEAYGVEYDRHGQSSVAYANKEIVITAGAVQTPKILMLSGIGPKSDLTALGIPVMADLPVGTNLQDHASVFVGPFFVDRGKSLDIDRDVSASAVLSLAKDKGPLTTTGFQAAAVVSSGLEKLHGSRNWPDLQLTMYGLSHHKSADEDFSHAFRLKKELLRSYFEHSKGRDSFSVLVSVGRPKSSGAVKLLNRNPYAPLIINPNYFDKIYDVVVMVDGVKKALRMVENSTVFHNELHARFTQQVLPGCEKFRFRSDAYFECYVRTLTVSLGNVAGTAAMGSVLNSKMQVRGMKGLRVMDASVMPSIVSTSTGGAVMMIAEKGADLLIKEWQGSGVDEVKNSNLSVADKSIKEHDANQLKEEPAKSHKSLFDIFKLKPTTSKPIPSVRQFSMADLQKLTKSMGNLASLLDPVAQAGSSPLKSVYTGSFDLGNFSGGSNKTKPVTPSPFDAMKTLAPILKSQFGGLYKHYFEGTDQVEKVKLGPVGSKTNADLISKLLAGGLKIPILSGNVGQAFSNNNVDPLKLIQGMIDKHQKDLDELEHLDKIKAIGKGKSQPNLSEKQPENPKKNITLDDMFGIADEYQDELVEYSDSMEVLTISTEKSVPIVKANSTNVTTTVVSSVTVPSSSSSTTKKPLFDYTYEILPVPMTKSKGVESSTFPSSSFSIPISAKPQVSVTQPVYPKPTTTIVPSTQTFPPERIEQIRVPILETSASIAVQSQSQPISTPIPSKTSGSDIQKLKNLEALAKIQHDTLAKLKQIQTDRANRHRQRPSQHSPQPIRQHAMPSFVQFTKNMHPPQYHQGQSLQPGLPSLDILPPPVRGRFPPPQYFQQHGNGHAPPPPSPSHYNSPRPPHPNHFLPGNLGGHFRSRPPPPPTSADPSDLQYAVQSIMNAKYTHSTVNPFTGILNYLGGHQSPRQESESEQASKVLKALQLRANVDKFMHLPPAYSQPSPIPITHRPTAPPPPTLPSTRHPPPPPIEEDGGIFAPLKDALEPFTKLMKGPLNLLPNPFKSAEPSSSPTAASPSLTSSIVSSLLPESLTGSIASSFLPSIFQHRTGPLSAEQSPEPHLGFPPQQPQPLPTITRNSLASTLPRFFMNTSKLNSEIPQEVFLLALANLTDGLPKPFVLEPSKTLSVPSPSTTSGHKQEQRNSKKLLDESISDILSNHHHFASLPSPSEYSGANEDDENLNTGSSAGSNTANEILNIDYSRSRELPTVKGSVVSVTPKTKLNPPVEFHKSPWAKEPSIPTKSLYFKIKIV